MLFEATVDGRTVRVDVRRKGEALQVLVDGQPVALDVQVTGEHFQSLLVEGRSYEVGLEKRAGGFRVHFPGDALDVEIAAAARGATSAVKRPVSGPAKVNAPMPGKIVRVAVAAGQDVKAGEALVVMEAMKMENEIRAPRDGRVREVAVRASQTVEMGALLLVLE